MRKLKYILLGLILLFSLNSCLTLAYVLGSYCADHGGCAIYRRVRKQDPKGVYRILGEKKYENYLGSILERKKEYVEIDGQKILLPEGMTFRKIKNRGIFAFGTFSAGLDYYLYDKKEKVGFCLGATSPSNDDLKYIEEHGEEKYLKKSHDVYTFKSSIFPSRKDSDYSYIKRIKDTDIYVTFQYASERESEQKIIDFLLELSKDW